MIYYKHVRSMTGSVEGILNEGVKKEGSWKINYIIKIIIFSS